MKGADLTKIFLTIQGFMVKYLLTALMFLFGVTLVFSQNKTTPEALLKRVATDFELLDENLEKAFIEAQKIEEAARKINAPMAEMPAMVIQCIYFRRKYDFEKMMKKAKLLSKKSKSYQAVAYRVMAKRFLFEAYYFTGLPEKAFSELEQGRELARLLHGQDSINIVAKGDLYTSFSNYYAAQGDFRTQLKFLIMAGRVFEHMPNRKSRKELLSIHYSNLATVYNEINELDSAKYYTKLSRSLNADFGQGYVSITNRWVLGSVAMKEKDYETALSYFLEAEKLEGYKNHLNSGELYDNIIFSYRQLNLPDSARIYALKKESLKLSIAENQNKSLHNLLNAKEKNPYPYLFVFIFLFVLMLGVVFIVVRKNKILTRQERNSQTYLKTVSDNRTPQNYTQLLQMLDDGNPAFMNYFDEMFPFFAKKLLEINPGVVQSEIEFCSLLKLKIPTKDIARYKFVTPKTVQNKKYLIRKKLDIPKEVDIYQWFDTL